MESSRRLSKARCFSENQFSLRNMFLCSDNQERKSSRLCGTITYKTFPFFFTFVVGTYAGEKLLPHIFVVIIKAFRYDQAISFIKLVANIFTRNYFPDNYLFQYIRNCLYSIALINYLLSVVFISLCIFILRL